MLDAPLEDVVDPWRFDVQRQNIDILQILRMAIRRPNECQTMGISWRADGLILGVAQAKSPSRTALIRKTDVHDGAILRIFGWISAGHTHLRLWCDFLGGCTVLLTTWRRLQLDDFD